MVKGHYQTINQKTESMKGGKYLKVAVIGLGKMGLLHASILNVLPNVQLSAICDRDTKIIRFAKKVFREIRVTDNLEELSDLNLDAIYITTPIPSHFPIIQAVYSKNIACNLFVEKTLASSYEETAKICEKAQTSGGINMVGYMCRFAVTFRKAKELLDKETIGKVISFKAYAYSSDFVGIRKKTASRGGTLRDLGAHIIYLALSFFGELEVDLAKLGPSVQDEDFAYFKVKGHDGLEGEFDISWSREGYRTPEWGLLVRGSKGAIRVNNDIVNLESNDGAPLTWHRHDLNDNVAFLLGAPEYFREDEHFVKSILEGHKAEPSFLTASKVDYLIDHVKHKTGQGKR